MHPVPQPVSTQRRAVWGLSHQRKLQIRVWVRRSQNVRDCAAPSGAANGSGSGGAWVMECARDRVRPLDVELLQLIADLGAAMVAIRYALEGIATVGKREEPLSRRIDSGGPKASRSSAPKISSVDRGWRCLCKGEETPAQIRLHLSKKGDIREAFAPGQRASNARRRSGARGRGP